MAWKEATQLTSSEGDVSSGILNDATGEFWYRRTDPESGQTWWRSTSGGMSSADPRGPDNMGGLLGYGSPSVSYTSEGSPIYAPNLESIGGHAMDAFKIREVGPYQYQALNPSTGQWEAAYVVPSSVSDRPGSIIPKSYADQIPGSTAFTNKPANNKGGFFEDYVLPTVIGGIATAGIGSMLGAGSLLGGTAAGGGALPGAGTGAAGLGLTEAELAAAGSGLGSGVEGAAIAAGPTTAGLTGAGATGMGGAMDTSWFEPWMDAATSGGTDTSYLMNNFGDMADFGSGAIPVDPTANTAGISDFIKGAIQSGNLSELAKVLPSIPGGSSALKSLFGGSDGSSSGTGSSLWDILGRAAPGLLGAYASNQQTNAMTDLANKFSEYGAPSRARYEASMTPGFDPTSIPGYSGALDTASQSILRKLSATGGNPYGNPGGLIEANKQIVAGTALPAIQQYQNQNANTGGLGALAAAYPSTQQAATQSGANVYNALGNAAGEAFNPKQTPAQSLSDIYKTLNLYGMKAT